MESRHAVTRKLLLKNKQFKVVSVSSNTNSFGLTGMVLVAKDGEAWECGANYIRVRQKGDVISFSIQEDGFMNFAELGFEIPKKLSTCPPEVVKEVWGGP